MTSLLHDDPAQSRFELALEEGVAFIDYRRTGEVLVLTHAEVPAALGGRGLGSRLVQETLELVRSRGERVIPRCPFIARFIARHPDYADLLADPSPPR
jgi:hypothetical protein